jgi:signal peptidase II
MKKDTLAVAAITLGLILLDQLTKFLALAFFAEPVKVLGDFLVLRQSLNPGIAFGIPIDQRIILVVTLALILLIIRVAQTEFNFKKMEAKIALILILSGALGNLLDRIIREEVVDFIAFSFWPSFNLADAFIVAGAVIAGVFYKKIKH